MKPPKLQYQCDGKDIYIFANGVKIAKRGHPGTSHAKTWVPLEPGWVVRDYGNNLEGLEISYDPEWRTVQ